MSRLDNTNSMVFIYDSDLDDRDFCRSLLKANDLATLKKDIKVNGFLPIETVRALIRQNTVKTSADMRGENFVIDAEQIMAVDTRIDFQIFIAEDNVYTRDELLDSFPFKQFNAMPETIFTQQLIGDFLEKSGLHDFVAKDVGDSEFVTASDLIYQATKGKTRKRKEPHKIAKSKIFIGKAAWTKFKSAAELVSAFNQYIAPNLRLGSTNERLYLPALKSAERENTIAKKEKELWGRRSALLDAKEQKLAKQEEELRKAELDFAKKLQVG